MSETKDRRHLTAKYCNGNGVDIGSGGDPVVPWAIQIDLPSERFGSYRDGGAYSIPTPIQWRTSEISLPFKDSVLDWVYSSHLLEDFDDWHPVLTEWVRVLKQEGHLVILVPCKKRFNEAVAAGQDGNSNHKHESYVGEISGIASDYGLIAIEDRYTDIFPNDYNILFVGRKI